MSQRIDSCFQKARESGRKVLIPFITAGDPDPSFTVGLMHSLVRHGADLLELGIPFSDPMADGPVIQASSERAVAKGVGLEQVLDWVSHFRRDNRDTPVVLMGYMNPFERFGYESLAEASASAGVDGILLVDCPPEEMHGLQDSLDEQGVYAIRLVAPTTTHERLQRIAASARGFIYYVSFKGTTGAGKLDTAALAEPVRQIRSASNLPVAVGFGIKDAESARAVADSADAIVMGSALVEQLSTCVALEEAVKVVGDVLGPVRQALDGVEAEAEA
jgi:tryptophan synthase alpha chain